jgi:small subunit ribosomal protein S17
VSEIANQEERGTPRKMTGRVLSHSRDKTIKVVVESMTKHPMYGKYMKRRTVCHVHDEQNLAKTGDMVEIQECRPISKTKSFRLVSVVEKSRTGEVTPAGAEG